MISDYYNELPTTTRIINEMNEELDNVRDEKDNEIAELKKDMEGKDDFIQDMFDYFSDEPDSVYMQKILKMPRYKNNPYIFHCDSCNCIADVTEENFGRVRYTNVNHYYTYFTNKNNIGGGDTDNLICHQCFEGSYMLLPDDGNLSIKNILGIPEGLNYRNRRIYINRSSEHLDVLILYTIRFIFEFLSEDNSEANNNLMDIFKIGYGKNYCEGEEEKFINEFKFLLNEKSKNTYFDMDECNEMDVNFYRLLYDIFDYPIEFFTKRRNRQKNKLNPLQVDQEDLLNELLERWASETK